MRKLLVAALLFIAASADAQVGNFLRVNVRDSINLNGTWVKEFSTDSTMGTGERSLLTTQKAVKGALVKAAQDVKDSLTVIRGLFLPITYQPAWSQITGKPTTFTPSAHTHAIADITSLQASLDNKADLSALSWVPSGSDIQNVNSGAVNVQGDLTTGGTLSIGSLPSGAPEDSILTVGATVNRRSVNAFGMKVADAAGTTQFTVPLGGTLRVAATNDASVSFNAGTNTVTVNAIGGSSGGGAVNSFNSRTGNVVSQAGDYNTSQVAESGSLYFTEARVRSTPLTGYAVGSNIALLSTDNILQAMGKLQAQINANVSSLNNYYTKTNLQTSGQASVHAGNITSAPWLTTAPSWEQSLAAGATSSIMPVVNKDPALDAGLYAAGHFEARTTTYPAYGFHRVGSAGMALYLGMGDQADLRIRTSSNQDYNLWHSGNLVPSETATASTIVKRNAAGYVFGTYFNSTDDVQTSGVTGVMVKTGDNYLRTGSAAAVREYIGFNPSSYAPVSGSGNYIQAQFAAPQNANAWISGAMRVGGAGNGYVNIQNAVGATGWVGFYKPDNTRLGYIGSDATNLQYSAENGAVHSFFGLVQGNSAFSGTQFNATAAAGFRLLNATGYIEAYNNALTTRTGYLQFNSGSNISLFADAAIPVVIGTNGIERMRIEGSGVTGSIVGSASYTSKGIAAGYAFEDRTTGGGSSSWTWYADGGIARLFSGTTNDRMRIYPSGILQSAGPIVANSFDSPENGFGLDVTGLVKVKGTTNQLRMGDLSSSATFIQSVDNSGSAPKDLVFFNTAERMRILANGAVGIGKSNPQTTLDVAGGIWATRIASTDGTAAPDTYSYAPLGVTMSATSADKAYLAFTKQGTLVRSIGIGGTGGDLIFGTGSGSDNMTATMRLTPTGHIITSDGGQFSNGVIRSWPSNSALTGFWHVNANPATGYAFLQDASGNTYLNTAGALDIRSGNSTKVYMLSNGNVGINTITPSTTLDVAGTAKVSNIQVTGGTPSAGKVLTATDGSGNATWSAPQGPLVLKDFYADNSSYSYTVPAGRLATDGDKLRFFVGGQFQTTQIGFFSIGVGPTTVGQLNITTGHWKAEVEIIRTSNSSVRVIYTSLHSQESGAGVKMTDVTGLNLSANTLFLSTYTDHSTSTVCQIGSITYLPSAPIP